jgi:molybdate transport system substrate-binding protein
MTAIRVLSAAAVRQGLTVLAECFGDERGIEISLTFATGPQIREKLEAANDVADVVIGPDNLIDRLAAPDRVIGATRAPLGGVEAGVAVKAGVPAPDISTPEALREALLAAEAVTFNTASSGEFIAEMIEGLGVADMIADKVHRFVDGGEAMDFLAATAGDTALGFGQSTGLKVHEPKGIEVVGPLPAEIGKVTTYVAAIAPEATDADGAKALIAYLTGDEGRARFSETGVM